MDDKPFLDLHHILAEFKDDRLWVFAEWVRLQRDDCLHRAYLRVPLLKCAWQEGRAARSGADVCTDVHNLLARRHPRPRRLATSSCQRKMASGCRATTACCIISLTMPSKVGVCGQGKG